MKKLLSVTLAALTLIPVASAKVHLNGVMSSNMVLQQQSDASLWGHATPNAKVKVSPSWGEPLTVKAGDDGRFMAHVATPKGSFKPQTITFTDLSDNDSVRLDDVLIGEVWLASGQSNMEMPLRGFWNCPVEGGYDEVAQAREKADKIRFITVEKAQSHTPQDTISAVWVKPSPETAAEFSAAAWHFARRLNDVLDVPVGIVSAAYGGAAVESWLPREIVAKYPDYDLDPQKVEERVHYYRPYMMYNAMFCPVKDYTYRGVIWYQGCSNVGRHDTFVDRFSTLINRWRKELTANDGRNPDDIPFYFVELAPWDFGYDSGALLREAQWQVADSVANTGCIGTNDLVYPHEFKNIHPAQKRRVGLRLGNLALHRTYGKTQFPVQHPRYKSHTVDGDCLKVTFDCDPDGLCRNWDVQGFEIAGDDGVYYPAEAVEVGHHDIALRSDSVAAPRNVRYCFHDFQLGTVYGADFLPLIPFRSDR